MLTAHAVAAGHLLARGPVRERLVGLEALAVVTGVADRSRAGADGDVAVGQRRHPAHTAHREVGDRALREQPREVRQAARGRGLPTRSRAARSRARAGRPGASSSGPAASWWSSRRGRRRSARPPPRRRRADARAITASTSATTATEHQERRIRPRTRSGSGARHQRRIGQRVDAGADAADEREARERLRPAARIERPRSRATPPNAITPAIAIEIGSSPA